MLDVSYRKYRARHRIQDTRLSQASMSSSMGEAWMFFFFFCRVAPKCRIPLRIHWNIYAPESNTTDKDNLQNYCSSTLLLTLRFPVTIDIACWPEYVPARFPQHYLPITKWITFHCRFACLYTRHSYPRWPVDGGSAVITYAMKPARNSCWEMKGGVEHWHEKGSAPTLQRIGSLRSSKDTRDLNRILQRVSHSLRPSNSPPRLYPHPYWHHSQPAIDRTQVQAH
ncbi:uncharacterized protein ARMOST_21833 [Armillaria ostoyae]|uniref:Uncharacterized protein n=1 Tax=Armillaria ostoyae TaxID=47428 RepID=A0A284SB68_ARMOS|nr:uncharacterized protein ARMOST_21833 [Armillaria ostoyae]